MEEGITTVAVSFFGTVAVSFFGGPWDGGEYEVAVPLAPRLVVPVMPSSIEGWEKARWIEVTYLLYKDPDGPFYVCG